MSLLQQQKSSRVIHPSYPVLTAAPASTRSIVVSALPRTTAQWRAENPFACREGKAGDNVRTENARFKNTYSVLASGTSVPDSLPHNNGRLAYPNKYQLHPTHPPTALSSQQQRHPAYRLVVYPEPSCDVCRHEHFGDRRLVQHGSHYQRRAAVRLHRR